MDNQRVCPWCFEYLEQREDEKDSAYAKRIYCNKIHAGLHARPSKCRPIKITKFPSTDK